MKFTLKSLSLILFIGVFTLHSCGGDDDTTVSDDMQMNDDDGMSALEVAREESVTTLTGTGENQTWRIGQALLTNENGSFDISDNFNIQDDEFIFSGDLVNPVLTYRARYDVNVDATSEDDTLLDFYLSDEDYPFSFAEGSSTELTSINGMFTFTIGEDNTISGVLTLPGRSQAGMIDLTLNVKQPGDFAAPLSGTVQFTEEFTFESNMIASSAPGLIGSYSENSLYMVTREDGLVNGDNIRPERIIKFDVTTGAQTENLFFRTDFVSKQLHIINNELIVIGGQFVNRYPLDFSSEPTSLTHGLAVTRHGMAVLDDNAYIIGGDLDIAGDGVEAEKVYSFNLNSNSIMFEADMPENRFGARATIVNNKMYVFGGTEVQFGNDASNSIFIIDLDNNSVVTESMPTNLHYSFVDKFENLIYVAGRIENFDGDGMLVGRTPYLAVYNTEDGSFTELDTDLDQTEDLATIHGMSIFNGKMYIIYGANGDDNGGQFPEWKILSTDIN